MSTILIFGLPFFPHKYDYVRNAYESRGYITKFVLDKKCYTNNRVIPNYIIDGKNSRLYRLINPIKYIIKYKPKNIDIYNYSIFTIYYILISRLFGVNTRLWVIGSELTTLDVNSNNSSSKLKMMYRFIKKKLTYLSVFATSVIIVKEKHHIESLNNYNHKLQRKYIFLHNCVPYNEFDTNENAKKHFLYANAVIKNRHVISMLKSFKSIENKGYTFTADIYGFNSINNDVYSLRGLGYSEECMKIKNQMHFLNDVNCFGFISNIKEKYKNYKFFVFPSEYIFANYALLEAMSFGLVPIIYKGNGFEMIIEHGYNGIVSNEFDISSSLEYALQLSEHDYKILSENSKKTIKEKFNLEIWSNRLVNSLM